jgi:hypothetical protein
MKKKKQNIREFEVPENEYYPKIKILDKTPECGDNCFSPANVPSGTKVTVTGKLTDNVGGAGVGGKTITFTGTGAANIASVTTNRDGTFTASGLAPTTINNRWTVQAHFTADNLYRAADSSVQSYNTVRTTPIPPDTTITSAVDGNGVKITNGSTTFSSSTRFTFTATASTNPIAGFECSLDNGVFSPCSSPTNLTNLAVGKHVFQVRAVDTSGNTDPTPASFSWTIATATPPSHTTITSAVDGNNSPIQNGGTTSSNSINLHLQLHHALILSQAFNVVLIILHSLVVLVQLHSTT